MGSRRIRNKVDLNATTFTLCKSGGVLVTPIQELNAVHSATVYPNTSTPPGGVQSRSSFSDNGSPRLFLHWMITSSAIASDLERSRTQITTGVSTSGRYSIAPLPSKTTAFNRAGSGRLSASPADGRMIVFQVAACVVFGISSDPIELCSKSSSASLVKHASRSFSSHFLVPIIARSAVGRASHASQTKSRPAIRAILPGSGRS